MPASKRGTLFNAIVPVALVIATLALVRIALAQSSSLSAAPGFYVGGSVVDGPDTNGLDFAFRFTIDGTIEYRMIWWRGLEDGYEFHPNAGPWRRITEPDPN